LLTPVKAVVSASGVTTAAIPTAAAASDRFSVSFMTYPLLGSPQPDPAITACAEEAPLVLFDIAVAQAIDLSPGVQHESHQTAELGGSWATDQCMDRSSSRNSH
jgi:hypothetical protein